LLGVAERSRITARVQRVVPRPDAALTYSLTNDHRQHKNVPNTKWAASTKNT
jgi:hypothetical protein